MNRGRASILLCGRRGVCTRTHTQAKQFCMPAMQTRCWRQSVTYMEERIALGTKEGWRLAGLLLTKQNQANLSRPFPLSAQFCPGGQFPGCGTGNDSQSKATHPCHCSHANGVHNATHWGVLSPRELLVLKEYLILCHSIMVPPMGSTSLSGFGTVH